MQRIIAQLFVVWIVSKETVFMSHKGWASLWWVHQVCEGPSMRASCSLARLTSTSQHSPLPPLNLPPPKSNHRTAFLWNFPSLGRAHGLHCVLSSSWVLPRGVEIVRSQQPQGPFQKCSKEQHPKGSAKSQHPSSVCSCTQKLCWNELHWSKFIAAFRLH